MWCVVELCGVLECGLVCWCSMWRVGDELSRTRVLNWRAGESFYVQVCGVRSKW